MLKTLPLLFFLTVGCSFGPGNLQSRHSTDLQARKIRRIAVLAPAALAPEPKPAGPFAPPAATEAKTSEKEAPDSLARLLYLTMASMSNWQVVSESEVREIGHSVRVSSEAARIKQIGERVYADAVITGRIQRFRERVGDEWGIKSPASVAFVLDLVDVRRGDVVWSASFDETQKSLSENILAIGEIGQRGVRWLTAEQLAHEGIKKAVAQLHQILVRQPNS
jgi:TolB-like protein